MRLCLHSFLPRSRANGPGERAVVWVQGCSLGCGGCFNPETHAFDRGEWVQISDLFNSISALGDVIEGITLSGGEPLQQPNGVRELLRRVHQETRLSAVLFTGFTWEEIQQLPGAGEILDSVDVVLAGRYNSRQRVGRGLRGSATKTVHFLTRRYSPADLDSVPEAEVLIGLDGTTTMSGINPVVLH